MEGPVNEWRSALVKGKQMTDSEILLAAAEILERGWCQENMAVDIDGKKATAGSQHACAHCASGAILAVLRANNINSSGTLCRCIILVEKHLGSGGLEFWNDQPTRTQGEVVQAFQNTAAALMGASAT
jgi:hypothetical protein